MHLDTVFTLASMTKLLTIIAVLQLVDRGLISLDEDVTKHLPALGAHPILTGFTPDGEPITTPRTRPITLRHLLTHSSGCGYAFLDPSLQTYISRPGSTFCNPTSTESTAARFDHPLLFEPGTGWAYGCSIDWAGELVPALTGVDLETHLQQHILSPLSLPQGSITFYPEHHHHESHTPSPKLACMTARSATTNRVEHSPFPLPSPSVDPHSPSEKRRAHFGGEAGYASLQSYISILHSLLLDDGKLLTPQTAAELFKPQLEPGAKEALLANVKNPFWIVGWVPDTGEYDWSLAGLLVDGDGHPLRRKGYLAWAGVFNLNWVSTFPYLTLLTCLLHIHAR